MNARPDFHLHLMHVINMPITDFLSCCKICACQLHEKCKVNPVCGCFQEVIRNLVKRYVAAMIRSAKTDEGLTEENFKV